MSSAPSYVMIWGKGSGCDDISAATLTCVEAIRGASAGCILAGAGLVRLARERRKMSEKGRGALLGHVMHRASTRRARSLMRNRLRVWATGRSNS